MKRIIVVLLGVFLLLPFVFAGCGGDGDDGTELLTNGGFETGDLTGWTYAALPGSDSIIIRALEIPMMAGSISVIAASSTPIGGFTTAGPSEGAYYAISDQDGPTTDAIIQEFTVPDGDDEIGITFDMFVLDISGEGPIDAGVLDHTGESNQHARVDILSAVAGTFDTGSGVIRNLYLGVDGYAPILPYISYVFDLSADLAPGETYILRFAQTDNLNPLNMGIDNVSIKSK